MLNSDGIALLALSSNLILPPSVNSTRNSSYPSRCRWAGISCDRSGYATSIELPVLRISDSLGKEIGLLRCLKKLNLAANDLSRFIPSELGNCTLLEHLKLSNNFLSGEIPVTLQNLEKLSNLALYNNSLSGNKPSLLFQRPSLEIIYLNDNNLNGSIPSFNANACNVKLLQLGQNNLSGTLPNSIGLIPMTIDNLTEMDVSQNDLEGNISFSSKTICKLERLIFSGNIFESELLGIGNQLVVLLLGNNMLNGTIPPGLANFSSLKRLVLSHNNLSDSIPEFFVASNLLYIDLSFNKRNGQIPQTVGNIVNLTMINLSMNKLDGPIPRQIENLSNLQLLNLFNNNLYGPLPFELSECHWLFVLVLRFNSFNGTIPINFENLSHLSQLILQEN
ncbi:leucine-rich repeat receptor-like protein kinase PEPR2 [Zingiber officinale]|uniref:leucine-rich repeat receptor-like protein kinase PEPR2 n=1 Tax=Zingiber officinale TaxID=94328 RepID=UPI001C4CEBF5|nr:leucine-rich repeat receptor-like protein kinase PEPR2 [Zingiber officinale]